MDIPRLLLAGVLAAAAIFLATGLAACSPPPNEPGDPPLEPTPVPEVTTR